ncbi:hypothetical protein GCM10010919_33180 [Alishewanella longhuensis]|uniref:DUF2913 family protein n=1 Tax=Alishewanella longhuensis TaxID=1091037 RepID=A0ABQ3L1W9_9ALTE|nr:hypothetical protein [Alishewanella longhuensis]GHG77487.1 hypothetical protein GCM10010919_33180 [Alishewanella longhuensis]
MNKCLVENFYKLATSWSVHCVKSAKSDAEREVYKLCAKQLRMRAEWLEKDLSAQKAYEIASILESFMKNGWIERYTIVEKEVKIWHTAYSNSVRNLLEALPPKSSKENCSSSENFIRVVCEWLNQPGLSSPSTHYLNYENFD